jgi:hypothetical protein
MDKIKIGNKKYGAKGEYVGRPSVLGNPFPLRGEADRDHVCNLYEEWFRDALKTNPVQEEIQRLVDKYKRCGELTLVCYCAPKRCHAQTIANEIERRINEESYS